MKKLTSGFLAATMIFTGITAFAENNATQDVYFGADNSVHIAGYNGVTGTDYTTVLIRESGTTDAGSVVYADQKSTGLDSVMNFMLKGGVADGNYTATFGNSKGNAKTINFTVGDVLGAGKYKKEVTLDQVNKMSVVDEPISTDDETFTNKRGQGLYKKSFTFTAKLDDFEKFGSVYVVLADGTGQGEIELYDSGANKPPSYTGSGDITFGIQIYNIPEDHKGMNLYLGEASK